MGVVTGTGVGVVTEKSAGVRISTVGWGAWRKATDQPILERLCDA